MSGEAPTPPAGSAAPDTGAGSGTATPPVAPGAPSGQPVTPQVPASATPPAAPDWMAALTPENRGHVLAKNVSTQDQLVEMWKGMEHVIGAPKERLAVLPSELKSLEDAKPTLQRLGVPPKAEDYGLRPLSDQGGTPEFTAEVQKIMHSAHLTKHQAEAVYQGWNTYQATEAQKVEVAYLQRVNAEKQALSTEWGAAHDQNIAIAKRAAQTFGASREALDALEKSSSYSAVMKLFHNIGMGMGESKFHQGNPGVGQILPEQAKVEREMLMKDEAWKQSYLKGDAAKVKKLQELLAAEMGIQL